MEMETTKETTKETQMETVNEDGDGDEANIN